eukprot:259731-Chlamydomonas_euryale.AAC.17
MLADKQAGVYASMKAETQALDSRCTAATAGQTSVRDSPVFDPLGTVLTVSTASRALLCRDAGPSTLSVDIAIGMPLLGPWPMSGPARTPRRLRRRRADKRRGSYWAAALPDTHVRTPWPSSPAGGSALPALPAPTRPAKPWAARKGTPRLDRYRRGATGPHTIAGRAAPRKAPRGARGAHTAAPAPHRFRPQRYVELGPR